MFEPTFQLCLPFVFFFASCTNNNELMTEKTRSICIVLNWIFILFILYTVTILQLNLHTCNELLFSSLIWHLNFRLKSKRFQKFGITVKFSSFSSAGIRPKRLSWKWWLAWKCVWAWIYYSGNIIVASSLISTRTRCTIPRTEQTKYWIGRTECTQAGQQHSQYHFEMHLINL